MKFTLPRKHMRRLGVSTEKREYDLPFHDDRANRFVLLLIGLMTYLAMLSGAGGMVLNGMADRWTTGLANRLSIEVPMIDSANVKLADEAQTERIQSIVAMIKGSTGVHDVSVQNPKDVAKLVEPWLGPGGTVLSQVPLPAIITVETAGDDQGIEPRLKSAIERIAPGARVETHQGWLHDLLRLTGTLGFTAYLIGFITAITTITAVGGAVRARMAAHHDQLEILHLIGASDDYITGQFQKHALQLSLYGSLAGFVAAMFTLMFIDALAGNLQLALVPSLVLSGSSMFILLMIPLLACAITVFTTRLTVLQSLGEMP